MTVVQVQSTNNPAHNGLALIDDSGKMFAYSKGTDIHTKTWDWRHKSLQNLKNRVDRTAVA
jgi:hypothetical protein